MALHQFTNLSTWREDKITVEPGKVYTLTFMDTRPNMFYIQNPNNVKLRVSIGSIPTHENYEFKIDENTTATLGRPIQTGYLYILNDGVEMASLTVYSIAKEFDMNVLKNLSLKADNVTLETDGIVRGFAGGVKLPSGDNVLGKVGLTDDVLMLLSLASTGDTQQKIFTQLCHFNDKMLECFYDVSENELKTIQNQLNTLGTKHDEVVRHINYISSDTSKLSDIYTKMAEASDSLKTLTGETIYGDIGTPIYINNESTETAISGGQSMGERVEYDFAYIFNDSSSTLNVLRRVNLSGSETILLTILPGEKLYNIKFECGYGPMLVLTGDNMMYRAKYTRKVLT